MFAGLRRARGGARGGVGVATVAPSDTEPDRTNDPPVVFGIPFDGTHPDAHEASEVMKKVVLISGIFFGIACLKACFTAFDGEYAKAMGELFWSSLIPACGYFGAQKRDKSLLLFFWCCNALSSVLAFIVIILYVWTISTTKDNLSCCEDGSHPCGYNALCGTNTTMRIQASQATMYSSGAHASSSYSSTSSHSSYSQYSSRSDASGGSNYRANSNDRYRQQNVDRSIQQQTMRCDCSYWTDFDSKYISTFGDDNFYMLIVMNTLEFGLAIMAVIWAKRLHDCPYFDPNRGTGGAAVVSTRLRTVQAQPVAVQAHPVAVTATPVMATAQPIAATVVTVIATSSVGQAQAQVVNPIAMNSSLPVALVAVPVQTI